MKAPSKKMLQSRAEIGRQKTRHQQLQTLAKQFRDASDAKEAKKLGEKLGRMIFGR